MLGCVPLSLIFGIVGIVQDKPKWLAITVTSIVSLLMLIYFAMLTGLAFCS